MVIKMIKTGNGLIKLGYDLGRINRSFAEAESEHPLSLDDIIKTARLLPDPGWLIAVGRDRGECSGEVFNYPLYIYIERKGMELDEFYIRKRLEDGHYETSLAVKWDVGNNYGLIELAKWENERKIDQLYEWLVKT